MGVFALRPPVLPGPVAPPQAPAVASDAPMTTAPPPATSSAGNQARAELYAHYVDDAVATANKNLDSSGVTNTVTDGEANKALGALLALPPHLQGEAVARLGESQFKNLLGEVPEKQREKFLSLVENTHDPKRKLLLWQQFHKAYTQNDLDRHGANKGTWFPSAREKREQVKNARRIGAVKETQNEVHDEVKRLLGKKKLTEKDVDKLMRRKTFEHELEMRHSVNITNERGSRWAEDELLEVQAALTSLPPDLVDYNPELSEIRREDTENSVYGFDGSFLDGKLTIYDTGTDAQTMVHELGHSVSDAKEGTFERYQKAAGWKHHTGTSLRQAGLSIAEVHDLHESLGKPVADRTTITKNGKVYQVDPNGNAYWQVDEGAVPGGPDWEYGRSAPGEHFAEHYQKAILDPMAVHSDFVAAPAAAEKNAQADASAARKRVEALEAKGAAKGEIDAARRQLGQAYQALARAQKVQRQRQEQFDIMRNDVFDTDQVVESEVARMKKSGASAADLKRFRDQAAKLSTPDQVRALKP